MLALWRGSAFADVDGYEAWEERVNERLAEAIQSGELAPDAATEREVGYTVVTSEPYLLVADGSAIVLSGIEAVGSAQSSPVTLSLAQGRYAVRASIVAWDEEPGGLVLTVYRHRTHCQTSSCSSR